ncbi:ATP-binding protein [Streptomyces sp. NPDC005336]|uniref:ATP-binding protein n=1 Tax=unclassified Streptomyces TaxID=2593676 RepID=UPI0033A5B948
MPNTAMARRETFRVSKHTRNVSGARARICKILADWGLSGDLADDITLSANELVANAIRHCRVTFAQIEISVSIQGRDLVLEVSDPDTDRIPELHIAAPDEEMGRGLFIVARLADAWGHRERPYGKCVWARFAISEGSRIPAEAAVERVAQAVAQAAWVRWLDHVQECTDACRTRGEDCPTAQCLRKKLREARAEAFGEHGVVLPAP